MLFEDNYRVLSTDVELDEIEEIIKIASLTPYGFDLERIFAEVRKGNVSGGKGFADVTKLDVGWQIKKGNLNTPITLGRVKVRDIDLSNDEATKKLGDTILMSINNTIKKSCEKHSLKALGYCRLIVDGLDACYFERVLFLNGMTLFKPDEFNWVLSNKSVLHGTHTPSGVRWFSWHGISSDNQLHFNGEKTWWPEENHPLFEFSNEPEQQPMKARRFKLSEPLPHKEFINKLRV